MTDVEQAILTARHFESILRERYRARGNGLGQKTRSVSKNLQKDIIDKLLYVAEVRNKIAHEKIDKIPDKSRFDASSEVLEKFFRESVFAQPDKNPLWSETVEISFWPDKVESSKEKRLYTMRPGRVVVHPVGEHEISTRRNTVEAGYVCMTPQSLPRLDISPLRSKDNLELSISIDLTVAIMEREQSIVSMIVSADQQLDTLKSQILLVSQRTCSTLDYDDIVKGMHSVAENTKEFLNEKVEKDNGSLYIVDCAIVDCSLEDVELEDIRRKQKRTIEEARHKADELVQTTQLDRLQRELNTEKVFLERQLSIETERHQREVQILRSQADADITRMKQQLVKEQKEVERLLALEASKNDINVQENIARAQMHGLTVDKAKAELAATSAGQHVLFPDQSFNLDRLRVNREAEFWRANFSDRKVNKLLELASGAGFNQAELLSLRTVVAQLSGVAITQRPAALQDPMGHGSVQNSEDSSVDGSIESEESGEE